MKEIAAAADMLFTTWRENQKKKRARKLSRNSPKIAPSKKQKSNFNNRTTIEHVVHVQLNECKRKKQIKLIDPVSASERFLLPRARHLGYRCPKATQTKKTVIYPP